MEDDINSILLWSDDNALIATNEVDLQKMLDKLSEWCLHWKLMVNWDKTDIVHFRKGFNFKCGNMELKTVDKYIYLGLIFTEFWDMMIMSKAVALSATYTLGLIISKCKTHSGVPHKVFSQLYDAWSNQLLTMVLRFGE